MWRTLLLGKMSVSIIASLVVGGYCINLAREEGLEFSEMMRWGGIGAFFLLLAVAQCGVIWLLLKKRKRTGGRSAV